MDSCKLSSPFGWMQFIPAALLAGALSAVPASARAQGGLLITEFMADNASTVMDEDKEFEDWVEIQNSSAQAIDLAGYSLTDRLVVPKKWVFPAVSIPAGGFLVVFCSGKDRRDPALELHTNFKLDNDGEALLLVAPDGVTVVFGYVDFPDQSADVSYGLVMPATTTPLVALGGPVRVLVPTADQGSVWTGQEYDDAAWRQGTLAVGFGVISPELEKIGTNVQPEMAGIGSSIYLRVPFNLADSTVDFFRLRFQYDDGFAAFINGQPVASGNAPAALAWDSRAVRAHAPKDVVESRISGSSQIVRAGANVLAIQGLNSAAANSDFFIHAEIDAVKLGQVSADQKWFFARGTPGDFNGAGFTEVAPAPTISEDTGVFVETLTVQMSTALAGGVIRYTLDDTPPGPTSTEYTAPIEIKTVVRLTARVFKDGLLPSPLVRRTYVGLDPTTAAFNSNLPLVLYTTFGRLIGANCGGGPYTSGHLILIEPKPGGRAALTDEPVLTSPAGFRRRGSSTCGYAKFANNIEFWDDEKRERNVDVFDFPRESDYILFGGNNFDRSMLRNPIAYWMSLEVGWWAARTRFVEVYYHTGNTLVRANHYFGVYAFMEKNKQHPDKIDVDPISSRDNAEPGVTGGYVLRRDRIGEAEVAISGGGYGSLVFVYPKVPTPAQRTYMSTYLNQTIASLNPNIGSQADNDRIDFLAWIDHHILCWYPKNVDAFRLSGYFYKHREGPMGMGPVWDYDRTMGCSDDSRADNPEGWDNTQSGDGGTRYFQAGDLGSWYSQLFSNRPPTTDTPWNNAYRARWRQLRAGPLKTDRILGQLDLWANEIREGADRNYKKWTIQSPTRGSFQGEVDHLKNWLALRAAWIDSQFVEAPRFSRVGGLVDPGTEVSLTVGSGAQIYFTLDGTDPKAANDAPSPTSQLYAGPITVTSNVTISARANDPSGIWSSVVAETFVTDAPRLTITEIMYAPLPPTQAENLGGRLVTNDMEWVEVANVGPKTVPLLGVRFGKGVTFTFQGASGGEIQPGETVVVTRNLEAFAARYGATGIRVVGPSTGALIDGGEAIALLGPLGETLVEFTYRGTWYPETNGGGRSLESVDPYGPLDALKDSPGWRASAQVNGTPGRLELGPAGGSRLPGDTNGDSKRNVTDVILLLADLFQGAARAPCEGTIEDAANRAVLDWTGDGKVDAADAIHGLRYLFSAGPPHAAGVECIRVEGCTDACPG